MSRLDRARLLLARPGAWLDAAPRGYPLRLGADRRGRISLTLDEADFRALVERPGLTPRPGGGWTLRRETATAVAASPAGRPGVVEGERTLMTGDGAPTLRRANLGQSALAWLATRRDPQGRPYLEPAELAAGERLRLDVETTLAGPSLTMRWDALPRSGGSAARVEPGDRSLAAGRRAEAALKACGPWRPMIEAVCVRGSALQAAEQALGLRRRTGRTALRAGLRLLAAHYRIG
jgi:hypothetical protein